MRLLLAPSGSDASSAAASGPAEEGRAHQPEGEPDDRLGRRLSDEDLAAVYAYPGTQPWLRANFVSTVDGAASGKDRRTDSINTPSDNVVFALLRALADVVLVGAGTVRDEGYRAILGSQRWRFVRQGRPSAAALAVVSRRGFLPTEVFSRRDGSGEVLLVTVEAAGADVLSTARRRLGAENVLLAGETTADQAVVRELLAARGLGRVLCEGGPVLMAAVVQAGMLDELCLTLSPLIVGGSQPRIVEGGDVHVEVVPHTLVECDGTLMGRWLVVRQDRSGTP